MPPRASSSGSWTPTASCSPACCFRRGSWPTVTAASGSCSSRWPCSQRARPGALTPGLRLPSSLSILAVLFPTDEERQKATAVIMGCTMLGYPLGPLLGGWLLNHFWWGSVFLINVPVAAVALVAIATLMPESRGASPSRLDGLGVVLSSLGLVGVTYGVIQAGQEGWSSTRAVAGGLVGGGGVG